MFLIKKALLEDKTALEEEIRVYNKRLEKMLAERTQALETTKKDVGFISYPIGYCRY